MNDQSIPIDPNGWQAKARRVLPGGNFGNMSSQVVIEKGLGAHIWDSDGNRYVDFLLGSGPMIVGHAHADVTAAVQAQVVKGSTFFANNPHGIALAEAIVDAVPCAQQVRFLSSGTEADFYAMRLARAFSGRPKILKFEGGYHGMSDYGLMSLSPKTAASYPHAIPDSPGIPKSVSDEMLVAPFNDLAYVQALIQTHHADIGGIIVEPLQRLIPPVPGFLQGLRELATTFDIPLIFDEVVTGFRFAYGGAQAYYGVTPDICTLGKICGGGFPLAAIAGRADIMAHFDREKVAPQAFLTQIGTLSGNPVAAAAGLATLAVLRKPGAYENLFEIGMGLMSRLSALLTQSGLPAQVVGEPPMFDVVFSDQPVRNYRDVLAGDAGLNMRLTALLRERGVFKGDSKYYVSLALTPDDIELTCQAWQDSLAILAKEYRARPTSAAD